MHTREQDYIYRASWGAIEVNENIWFILPSTTDGLVSLGKPSKKKNCEGSEYGPIGGGGGLEKSLLIVNLW